jgi:uncharacterized protein YjbI with pentapeptide repeats
MKYIVSILLAGVMFMALIPASAQDQKTSEWTGKLANGRVITKEDLSKIIKEHEAWLASERSPEKRIDLSGADLSEADLREADLRTVRLREADLRGAILSGANLHWADLSGADLSGAYLGEADLSGAFMMKAYLNKTELTEADLTEADLTEANLFMADLREANLYKAKLSRADLSDAILSEADLRKAKLISVNLYRAYLDKADLSEAILYKANLRGAVLGEADLKKANAVSADFSGSIFEPRDVEGLLFLGAKGFSTIRILFWNFKAVVDLRRVAREYGFRNEERALTAALRKNRLRALPLHERIFESILLDLPTDSGANPWRSFCVLACFIVIFSFYYMNTLRSHGKDGIWKIWIPERVRKDLGKQEPTRLTLRGWAVVWVGLYFSVLSAFNIGWRELNVGNWIARIQRREYIYRATGWTRTVSGIQSLLSVYLLALWALTYFGRPFE